MSTEKLEHNKLERVFYASCKSYKNCFKERGNGYNILAASDKEASRERLIDILNLASEPIRNCKPDDFVFTFTPATNQTTGGVFCASFPTVDVGGRTAVFKNVVYGLQKDDLELHKCVELFWNERIRGVCERNCVWPDDDDEPNDNKDAISLDELKVELKAIGERKRKEFWEKLKNDPCWREMFSSLLRAYFQRKSRDCCIFLVAPAEDVALAVWGMARLLPKSVVSDVSFAIRESRLYFQRTITGLDMELQREFIDARIREIRDGLSDDVLIFAEGEKEKIIGVNSMPNDRNEYLHFLTGDYSSDVDKYDKKLTDLIEISESYNNLSSLSLIEQLDFLNDIYCFTSQKKDPTILAFKEIEKKGYSHHFKRFIITYFNKYWTCALEWNDPEFVSLLWRYPYHKKADSFVQKFKADFIDRERKDWKEFLERLCGEPTFAEYLSKHSNNTDVSSLADSVYKKSVGGEVMLKEFRFHKVFLKVFQKIVLQNNIPENLEKLYVWHNDDKEAFFRFIFEKCECFNPVWKNNVNSKNYVRKNILEYCFGQSELKEDFGTFKVYCLQEEPIISYIESGKDDFLKGVANLLKNDLPKDLSPSSRLNKLQNLIDKFSDYSKRVERYKEIHNRFSKTIKEYKDLYNNVKSRSREKMGEARKQQGQIKKRLGFDHNDKSSFLDECFDCSLKNDIKKKLDQASKEYGALGNKSGGFNILLKTIKTINSIIDEEHTSLEQEYKEIFHENETYLSVLKSIDTIVQDLNSSSCLPLNLKMGSKEKRYRLVFLSNLFRKNAKAWDYFGENPQKPSSSFTFIKEPEGWQSGLLMEHPPWNIGEIQSLKENDIKRLEDPFYKNPKRRCNDFLIEPKVWLAILLTFSIGIVGICFLIRKGGDADKTEPKVTISASNNQDESDSKVSEEKRVRKEDSDSSTVQKNGTLPLVFNGFEKKDYRLIKAGSFHMGTPLTTEGHNSDARRHPVKLTEDFYLAKYPVTKGDFGRFYDAKKYKTTAEKEGSASTLTKEGKWQDSRGQSWRSPGFKQEENEPVVCVSYEDALAYIAWLNENAKPEFHFGNRRPIYRLPTEAEWEYACRADTDSNFFWGDKEEEGKDKVNAAGREVDPNGNQRDDHFPFDDGYSATSEVGKRGQNNWELCDMLGNVWEWTSDWYGDYPTEETTDPKGADYGAERVLRGGGWNSSPVECGCAYRGKADPKERRADYGFRVAFSLESVPKDENKKK